MNWSESGERTIFGPDLVQEAEEKVRLIQKYMKAAQCRQEMYANKRRRSLVFEEGDHVYLKVSPMKGVQRFGVRGKLAPRYIGPFKITQRCGKWAYRLELPPSLSAVHNVFHVSQLKKCLKPNVDMVKEEFQQLQPDLTYTVQPLKILDQKERITRQKSIKFYKIHWQGHSEREATWETEEFMKTHYPDFSLPNQGTESCCSFCSLSSF